MKCLDKFLKDIQWTQYFAASVVTISGFGLGNVLSFSAEALPSLQESHQVGDLSSDSRSWIGSFMTIGALSAGPITGYFVERFGRKTSLFALSVPLFFGWVLIATAGSLPAMYTGRILTGFGVGGYTFAAPIYISETTSDNVRGALVSLFQMMISLGKLFCYTLGLFVSSSQLALICSAVPLIYGGLLTLLPESPWYFLAKGKTEEAKDAIGWFRGNSGKSHDNGWGRSTKEEMENIQRNIQLSREEARSPSYHLLPHVYRPILIMMGVMLLSQFCGINALTFYSVEIFKKGGDFINANLATIVIGIFQVLTAIPATYIVDAFGRKILLVTSFVIMHISLVALGVYFYLANTTPDVSLTFGWIPTVSCILFSVGFSIGIGPVSFVLMREIVPNAVLGFATAMVTTVNWTSAFVVTKCFENFRDELGEETCFGFFAVCCALGVFFVLLFVPETKGKNLCDIQKLFK